MSGTSAAPSRNRPERSQLLRAVVASTIGTSIEWYDFFLYGSMAALVFPKLFFPKADPYVGALDAFATFFVGFIGRPIGAAIFGHFGDRVGRKAMLIATLLVMGLGTFVIGVIPGHEPTSFFGVPYPGIGLWAAVLLVLLRIAQGIGVGGEWGGSVLLSMEWGAHGRRGFITSWPQFGVPVGGLCSTGMIALVGALTGSNFEIWGWRIVFLASIVLVGVGLYVRLGILETPLFTRLIEQRRIEPAPLVEVCRRNWREIILSALLRLPEQAPFYIFTAFILTFGTKTLHLSSQFLLYAVIVAYGLELISIPVFGHVSDIIGRKRMYLIGIVAMILWAIPYYAGLQSGVAAVIFLFIVISLIPHDMEYGPQAALIAESFTGRLRYSGSSLGYQLASIIAGGPAPLIAAALMSRFNNPYAISGYIILISLIGLGATLLMREHYRTDITREYDEPAEPRPETSLQPAQP
jgi:MFS family permease